MSTKVLSKSYIRTYCTKVLNVYVVTFVLALTSTIDKDLTTVHATPKQELHLFTQLKLKTFPDSEA